MPSICDLSGRREQPLAPRVARVRTQVNVKVSNGAGFEYLLDRAAQDLLQVSFFDRSKTRCLRPAPLPLDMIALLLISAAEQVVD
jgi:hypothetical protein